MLKALRPFVYIFVSLLLAAPIMAQVAGGTYTYGTFDNRGVDTINVGNLNVHVSIPVLSKAGRGMPFYYNLSFDNSVWYPVGVSGSQVWTPVTNFGWKGDTEVATGYMTYRTTTRTTTGGVPPHQTTCTSTAYSGFTYHDSFGASHGFSGATLQNVGTNCVLTTTPGLSASAQDGSGYSLNITSYNQAKITSSSGKAISVPNSNNGAGLLQDPNGNQITVDGSGNFTDTTGNVALTVSGNAPSPHLFTYKDTSGISRQVTMSYVSYSVQTAFGCSGIGEYGPTSTSLVDAITFADGTAYHFIYEATPGVSGKVTGRIAEIRLPQGGYIHYDYTGSNNGIECADGSTAGLTRILDADSGSVASNSTYSRTTGTNTSHTDFVDGAATANHTSYDFVQATNQATLAPSVTAVYYETNRTIHEGTSTVLLARNTCYNGSANPCTTTSLTLPISQIDTYETLDSLQTHGSTTKFSSYGAQTETDTYDFGGASARGSLLSTEKWTYAGPFANLATEDDLYDSGGSLSGKSTYQYDAVALTASSGVPQHVAVTGARGNLNTVENYADATHVDYSSGGSASYEDTGSPIQQTYLSGLENLSYDSSFVYNTGTALPTPSSGVAMNTIQGYDTTYTGLLTSSKDPNSQLTTYSYDSMLRPTEIDSPDLSVVKIGYTPTTQTYTTYAQGSSTVVAESVSIVDGYGRLTRSGVFNGQSTNPWYLKDICYDGNGNVAFVSYPYQAATTTVGSVCSTSADGDKYAYDPLGRVQSVTRGNGESVSYLYKGRATQSTDENSVKKITQIDGLGRTTIACEITSVALTLGNSGPPASCGTDLAGSGDTGYATTYAYALATHTTTVTQGSAPGTVQTRIFQTDWVGRPILVQEPEMYAQGMTGASQGQTTYAYTYNATGTVVTRTRPKANQGSNTVTATTTTQYDALNRPVSITYSDGTPPKAFSYDASAGWTDLSQTNIKGRLSRASVSGTGVTSNSVYDYDAMGRIADLDECLPTGCGTSTHHLQHYTYDPAGNLKTSTDGNAVLSTYTVSQAGELQLMTSTLNNSTNPPTIVSAVQNGANGPSNFKFGNGLTRVSSYDGLGRLNGGWLCSNSTSPSCTGGTNLYGFTNNYTGIQLKSANDTVLSRIISFGYDDFNRLSSRTVTSGATQNYNYLYDRWGNRWQQNVTSGTGNNTQLSFNSSTNQVNGSGYVYDAAGNMTNDSFHTYTYDADGNITAVDGGSTAAYVYNALNQRVSSTAGGSTTEFVFNVSGQRVSTWNGSTKTIIRGQYYWGSKPVAFYVAGSSTHFQHQDWLGTERVRTTYNATVENSWSSLPFGDAQTITGTDLDPYHFASLDTDAESGTDHAQFRQYSSTQGHWMSPDPYTGSYDLGNPQSLNRYTYALNNPLSLIDPYGLYTQKCNDLGSDGYCWDECDANPTTCGTVPPPGSYYCQQNPTACGSNPNGGGGGQAPTANKTCYVPLAPPGVSIDSNIKGANLFHAFSVINLPIFLALVHNKGSMDYKQVARSISDTGELGPSPFAEFGNFNYGAVGAAFGIPRSFLLRGAGWAQERAGTSSPEWGNWKGGAPYGDDPNDQAQIIAGYNYYQASCYQKK